MQTNLNNINQPWIAIFSWSTPHFSWWNQGKSPFYPCLLTHPQILQGPRAFRPSWRMGRARHRDLRRGHRGERRGARHGQRRQQRRPLAALALQREHGAKRRGPKIMDFVGDLTVILWRFMVILSLFVSDFYGFYGTLMNFNALQFAELVYATSTARFYGF